MAHLHDFVPASRDDDRVLRVGAEADARDPTIYSQDEIKMMKVVV